MLSKCLFRSSKSVIQSSVRTFGAMDQVDYGQFEHKFSHKVDFKDKMETKFPCFRVIDENGVVVNKAYENEVPKDKLI
jgi:hypothetical protein